MANKSLLTPTVPDSDLDEDLFAFDEVGGSGAASAEDEANLDELFATFHVDEAEEPGSAPQAEAEEPPPPPASGETSPPGREAPAAAAPAAPPGPAGRRAPVSAPPVAAAAVSGGVPRSMIAIFVALTSINALLAIVVLAVAGSMSSGVHEMTTGVKSTVDEFANRAMTELGTHRESVTPVTPTDPANHEAFDAALAEIATGRHAEARRILYALLAVVDRMDPVAREKIEARANYMIAHAYQMEAHDRLGIDR
ncbi:MAG: hypothetical protein AB1726_11190 [Planctomycetota bacterium]